MSSSSLLGCGWLGVPLAQALLSRGFVVRGSTTRSARLSVLSSLGIEPVLLRLEGDAGQLSLTPALERFFSSETFVIDIPPETALGEDYHVSQVTQILSCLRGVRHLLYVSSTSVYGSAQGSVSEETACTPDAGSSGSILLRAEELVRSWALASGAAASVVRAGGLIGPGRHPGLFLAGRRGVANPSVPVNMIAQTDLVELLAGLLAAPRTGFEIYNAVALGHPLRSDFYERAARSIGVAAPEFVDAGSAAGSGSGKVVESSKIRRVTGVTTRFDDLYSAFGSTT